MDGSFHSTDRVCGTGRLGQVPEPSSGPLPPELLSPAGDWDCARAAVENGADAIYFGLDRFNARMRAENFREGDLPRLMDFLHRRGVKGYVTFNTLVFSEELNEAERYLRSLIGAGVDAAIVQDIGICRLIRRLSRDFPIHASTQMTITSAAGVEFARRVGCDLVVLARECSLTDIAKIRESAETASLPLEVFVHGALCVAYSGQCLTSEALGGRSANRGECAQACRMPYDLICDGSQVPLGDRRYLLSPQDLAGIEVIPDLIRAGVRSFKIEGRLKTPEYVANITRHYRRAIDESFAGIIAGGQAAQRSDAIAARLRKESAYDLEMAFSRGLYTGWLRGINNQELAHARFGKKRGVYLGEVLGIDANRVTIQFRAPVKAGDGVVFDSGRPDQPEEGARIFRMKTRGAEVELEFRSDDLHFDRIRPGNKVWKTSDPELDRRLRKSFAGDEVRFQRPVALRVAGRAGEPLTVTARDDSGIEASIASRIALEPAEKHPLTVERLREQLGRLGGTPFRLGALDSQLEQNLMLPLSELNRLRRAFVDELISRRTAPRKWDLKACPLEGRTVGAMKGGADEEPRLRILVRNLDQLDAAMRSGCRWIYCEFEDPKKYREAVRRFRERGGVGVPGGTGEKQRNIFVAPPRITKPGEHWILEQVRSSDADGYLVRNHDHLEFFRNSRCVGDFSFNVANELSAEYFKSAFALERLTASYDLNIVQLEALLRNAPPSWFEITIHQHMPMFHMEHCVFCAFLSSGTDYRNCGRPCDRHRVRIRDRVGAEHSLKADAGCRNTVFNSRAQTGAEYVDRLLALGARDFRVEFVDETPAEVERMVGQYARLLRGEMTGSDLWRELKLINQLGVTRGPMEQSVA